MVYNLTNITAANNIYEIANATNDLSGGLIFTFILAILFFTFLVVFHKKDFRRVLLADGFFTTILAILGYGMGYIKFEIVIIPMIIMFASFVLYKFVD